MVPQNLPPIVKLVAQGPKELATTCYDGALANEGMISSLLQAGYVGSVVRLVWAEQNTDRKLKFLQARANEGYAIFMYEYARVLIDSHPRDALFWCFAGFVRTSQDVVCVFSDPEEASQIPGLLSGMYQQQLKILQRFSKEHIAAAINQVREYLKAQTTYPSPLWVLLGTPHTEPQRRQDEWPIFRRLAIDWTPLERALQNTYQVCAGCNTGGTGMQRCGWCKLVYYCDRGCQSTHWRDHKPVCKPRQGEQ